MTRWGALSLCRLSPAHTALCRDRHQCHSQAWPDRGWQVQMSAALTSYLGYSFAATRAAPYAKLAPSPQTAATLKWRSIPKSSHWRRLPRLSWLQACLYTLRRCLYTRRGGRRVLCQANDECTAPFPGPKGFSPV